MADKKPKKEIDARFKKFGTVSFTATTKVNDFVDYLEKGQVAGTRCTTCGQAFFPPRIQCSKCLDKARIEWFVVEKPGKLITWSKLEFAPIGFQDDVPYAIALADFGEHKVFGRIGDIPFEDLEVGMGVKVRVNTLSNGQLNYVFDRT